MSRPLFLAGAGAGGGGGVAGIANRSLGAYASSVSHWPPQAYARPPGFGRTSVSVPQHGTYYSSLSAMLNGAAASTRVDSVQSTNIDVKVPSTAMFIATNESDGSLETLSEGQLMFALAPETEWQRGTALNIAGVNSRLLEAAWSQVPSYQRTTRFAPPIVAIPAGDQQQYNGRKRGRDEDPIAAIFNPDFARRKQEAWAITVSDAVKKWLPLGPLLGVMTDSGSDHTAFTYATTGPVMVPQLATDLKVGDWVGLVYTELDMTRQLAPQVLHSVAGIPLSDRLMPPAAVQVRFVNLSSSGLRADGGIDTNCGLTGDDAHVNPYDPVLGIKQSQLANNIVIEAGEKTLLLARRSVPHTVVLGRVLHLPTARPTQELVDAAHVSQTAYAKLYEEHRAEIAVLRRTGPSINYEHVVAEHDRQHNKSLLERQN